MRRHHWAKVILQRRRGIAEAAKDETGYCLYPETSQPVSCLVEIRWHPTQALAISSAYPFLKGDADQLSRMIINPVVIRACKALGTAGGLVADGRALVCATIYQGIETSVRGPNHNDGRVTDGRGKEIIRLRRLYL